MRKVLKLLFLVLSLSASGCVVGQYDDCIQTKKENVTVRFSVKDHANNQLLHSVIENISLFFYDLDGKQVTRSTVSKNDLKSFSGTHLQLEPGTYTVVAWANHTSTYSKFFVNEGRPYFERASNYLLNAVAVNGVVETSDSLYYAPKEKGMPLMVVVPKKGNVEVTPEFRNAHIKLDVTVEGYSDVSTRAVDPLTIELTDITSRYSFGMEAHGDKVSYTRLTSNIDKDKNMFRAIFNIPVFNGNTTTHLRVISSAGRLIINPISLKELLGDKVVIDEILHLPIKIKFTEENGLLQAVVIVDLPEWLDNEVKPNI